MKSAFKLVGLFTAFILFLSITIKNRTIFDYCYDVISPVTIAAQRATEDFFHRSISGTKTYSKKIFDNSVPRLKDSVKSKMASPQSRAFIEPEEVITVQEKEELQDLIKNHQ